jgi:hypothetical protein
LPPVPPALAPGPSLDAPQAKSVNDVNPASTTRRPWQPILRELFMRQILRMSYLDEPVVGTETRHSAPLARPKQVRRGRRHCQSFFADLWLDHHAVPPPRRFRHADSAKSDHRTVGLITAHGMPSSIVSSTHLSVWLLGATAFACAGPEKSSESPNASFGGLASLAGGTFGGTSAAHSGASGLATFGGSGTPAGGGSSGHAGSGGRGDVGMGGTSLGGTHSAGVSGGGSNAGASAGGGAGTAAVCPMVASEYQAELERQLLCNPQAASQCANKVAAAPGCECRVFIQPSDPFAIENLFVADCSMPICPAKCSTAATGTCRADPSSALGGRCVTP